MGSKKTTRRLSVDVEALLDRCRYDGPGTDWNEIVGHEAAKRELAVIAEQYRRSSMAELLGLTLVKGVIVSSPPGAGKTMLARALAGSITRAMYVIPSSEANATVIRAVYEHLRNTPCLIVWDEADVILRDRLRSNALQGGRTVAALCAALDGIDALRGPITLCLTAEEEYGLDESALRSGRLSTRIVLSLPDRDERRQLWERYTARVPVLGDLDLAAATDRSTGFTGADVEATVLAALGLAMVSGIDALDEAHLMEAILRRGHVADEPEPSPEALRSRAIHEASHAVFGALTWGAEALATVTLQPSRPHHGGRTSLTDAIREDGIQDRTRIRELAGIAYAGLIGEELIGGFGHVTIGCGDDVAKATRLLRSLIADLATSEAIGPVDVDGLEAGSASDRGSERMRALLYDEVNGEATAVRDHVRAMLADRTAAIEILADRLLAAKDRTLSGPTLTEALEAALQ
ncbi:MAG: AAA family ATPase [Candidatus Limnocylindrales bacterium]